MYDIRTLPIFDIEQLFLLGPYSKNERMMFVGENCGTDERNEKMYDL